MDEDSRCQVDGCCSAKAGANLIGMLYGILAFYSVITSAEYTGEVLSMTNHEDVKHFLDMHGLSSISSYNVLGKKTLMVTTIAAVVMNSIAYIFSALVVIGVNNRNARLLLPWILYSIILLVFYIIAMLFTVAVIIALYGVFGFLAVIAPAIFVLVLWALCIVVVNKHYNELARDVQPGDIVRKNSAAAEDNGNTSTPQGVSYLSVMNPRVRQIRHLQ